VDVVEGVKTSYGGPGARVLPAIFTPATLARTILSRTILFRNILARRFWFPLSHAGQSFTMW
jgi:hypothetical protein